MARILVTTPAAVGLRVEVDGRSSSDADGDMLSYRWSVQGQPAGSTTQFFGLTGDLVVFAPDKEGNYLLELVVSDGKATAATATTSITVGPSTLRILTSPTEPVTDKVRLSLDGAVGSTDVTWLVDDTNALGIGDATQPGLPVTWNTFLLTSGIHRVAAHLRLAGGAVVPIEREVAVAHGPIRLDPQVRRYGDRIELIVRALADAGIASVSARLGDRNLGTLSAVTGVDPVPCPPCTGLAAPFYTFVIDASTLGPGDQLAEVVAMDNVGRTQGATVRVR